MDLQWKKKVSGYLQDLHYPETSFPPQVQKNLQDTGHINRKNIMQQQGRLQEHHDRCITYSVAEKCHSFATTRKLMNVGRQNPVLPFENLLWRQRPPVRHGMYSNNFKCHNDKENYRANCIIMAAVLTVVLTKWLRADFCNKWKR